MAIQIYKTQVGKGQRPFITVDLSLNHQGELSRALAMIEAAAEVGIEACKIQYYKTEDFVKSRSKKITYQQRDKDGKLEKVTESEYKLFKRHEVDYGFVEACYTKARNAGLAFGVTTTSYQGVNEIARYADYLKVASDMVRNTKMITTMRNYPGRPLVISTGHLAADEVAEVVKKDVDIVLHCQSEYPTMKPELDTLELLLEQGYTAGYSDHTIGTGTAMTAIASGACFIECHLTLNQNLPGPDHHWSKTPKEMKEIVDAASR